MFTILLLDTLDVFRARIHREIKRQQQKTIQNARNIEKGKKE